MIIANPMQNRAFRELFNDRTIARRVLSRLLQTEITELTPTAPKKRTPFIEPTVLPFAVTGPAGPFIVHLCKAMAPPGMAAFRNALAAHYMLPAQANRQLDTQPTLPVVAIYLLGYILPQPQQPIVAISPAASDLLNDVPATAGEFGELLTTRMIVVQTPLLHRTSLQSPITRALYPFRFTSPEHVTEPLLDVPNDSSDRLVQDMLTCLESTGRVSAPQDSSNHHRRSTGAQRSEESVVLSREIRNAMRRDIEKREQLEKEAQEWEAQEQRKRQSRAQTRKT